LAHRPTRNEPKQLAPRLPIVPFGAVLCGKIIERVAVMRVSIPMRWPPVLLPNNNCEGNALLSCLATRLGSTARYGMTRASAAAASLAFSSADSYMLRT
jgi:hypothetical protein